MIDDIAHIAILAGGQSRRMGTNKARLSFEKEILISRLVSDAKTQNLDVLLCADDIQYPEVLDKSTHFPDLLQGKAGALSAIQPALEYCFHRGEKWLWVYACDSLIRPSELLPYIRSALDYVELYAPETKIILPKAGKTLPLLGLYRTELYAQLKEYVQQGERRVMRFCDTYPVYEYELPETLNLCCNFNTPIQYNLGKKQYREYLYHD